MESDFLIPPLPDFQFQSYVGMCVANSLGVARINRVDLPASKFADCGGLPFNLFSIQLISAPNLTDLVRVQYKFPRTKKRRIQRKWNKDPRYFKTVSVPSKTAIFNKAENKLFMHPETLELVKKSIDDINQLKERMEKHAESHIICPS